MLRLGYMASDFHPKLLVLGNKDELKRIAQLLSEFAANGQPIDLVKDGAMHAPRTEVRLQEISSGDSEGISIAQQPSDKINLTWHLTRDRSAMFADEVASLVNSDEQAGSASLECGKPDEIKVVVSFGEWDDDFLA